MGWRNRRIEGDPVRRFLPHEALETLDEQLARMGRGAGALRLGVGEALNALETKGRHHGLGFSSLNAYARERCGRSGRWAAESRTLARRLAKLPALREALRSGRIGWSMAELLARHATPEGESALLAEATGATVRQMRWRLKQRAGDETDATMEADDEAAAPLRTLRVTVPAEHAWLFEATRMLIEHLEGGQATIDQVVEIMLAEGSVTLQNRPPEESRFSRDLVTDPALHEAYLQQVRAWRDEAEQRCEPRLPQHTLEHPELGSRTAPPEDASAAADLGTSALQIDAQIRRLCAELASRDLAIGDAARKLFDANGWRRLGYATETQYARERLGLSQTSLKSRMTLSRRAERLPQLADALRGDVWSVGYDAASLIGRIATEETAEGWLRRASERTVKHLREEVQAMEFAGRMLQTGELEPPDDDMLALVHGLESKVLGGQWHIPGSLRQVPKKLRDEHEGQMSAGSDGQGDAVRVEPRRGVGSITLQLRVRRENALAWREMERAQRRSGFNDLDFVEFLCLAVWDSWHPAHQPKPAYADIYARDRYRCASPVCTRSDVTPHHLTFRAHGGDDSAANLASLCAWCHLEGIHGGRIKARPPAERISWQLGSEPVLRVHGRTKIERCA